MRGVKIVGGTLSTDADGLIRNVTFATLNRVGLTNAGNLQLLDSSRTDLLGSITNTGDIFQLSNPSPTNTDVVLLANVTLDGAGTWHLSDTITNHIRGSGGPFTLTNEDNTVWSRFAPH